MKTHTIKKLQRIGKLVKAHLGSDPTQPGFKNKVLRLAQKNDLGVIKVLYHNSCLIWFLIFHNFLLFICFILN